MTHCPEDQIPLGPYCYDKHGLCPFWHISGKRHWQRAGYCDYLEFGDWEVEVPDDWPEGFPTSALSLLWDQVKECGVNTDGENDERGTRRDDT